jgi:LysR family transcriptional regulator, hydrogen peroxide-inducible genes activator
MNIQQLEYIVALDKLKSFSRAADSCSITQATLSTMVKKLEEELGMMIFDRKTNPVITTDCGREIVQEAARILFHVNRMKIMATEQRGRIEGALSLGIIPTIAGSLLPRIVPEIGRKYPNLQLQLHELTTRNVVEQVKNGKLDAGIVSTPLELSEIEEDILYYEKLMVYGSGSDQQTQYASPKDISKEKIWLLEQGNCLTDQILNICSLKAKATQGNIRFNPNTFDSLLNMVDAMQGLTLIPELYAMNLSDWRKAKIRDFQPPYPVREVSLIYHRPYAKLRLLEALAKEIRTAVHPLLQTSALKSSAMHIAHM